MIRYLLIMLSVFALTIAGKLWLDSGKDTVLPIVELSLQLPCDLHQAPCIASDAQGRSLRVSINPNSIPLMEELLVQVETSGLPEVRSLRLTVEGVNMFMGYQYADLHAISPGRFQGKLILPVCTLEKMQWLAMLEALTPSLKVAAKIPFETISNTPLPPFNQDLIKK